VFDRVRHFSRLKTACLALLVAACGLAWSAANSPVPVLKEKSVFLPSPYAVHLGGPGRDSYSPATAHAAGHVEWTKPLGLPATERLRTLLVWQDRVVADSGTRVSVFSTAGEPLWNRPKRPGTFAVVGEELLYSVNRTGRLEGVDTTNRLVLSDAPFPGLASSEFAVVQLWPRKLDFVSATYVAEPTYSESDPSRDIPKPRLVVRRTVFGKAVGAWGEEILGAMTLDPLYQPELEMWLVAHEDVRVVDLKTGTESPRFKLLLDTLSDWSIGRDGVLCVMGTRGGRKTVAALTTTGQERWRWSDDEGGDAWALEQPPIHGVGGRVFVLTEGRVIALDDGKVAWVHDARSDSLRHGAQAGDGSFEVKDGRLLSTAKLRYGTALADGSILVVGNRSVRQLDATGRRLFSVALSEDVVTPPVVDADGSIFVGTATTLVKIR
jgi:hypothetical protein